MRRLTGSPQKARKAASIRALDDSDAQVRLLAIRLMHEWPLDGDLAKAAHRAAHDSDLEVRLEATRLLAKNPAPTTLPVLLEFVASTADSRAAMAAEALARHGEAAVPGLTKLLEDDDETVRWRATLRLAKIAETDQAALPALLKAFHDDSPNVAWVAADGLLARGPAVAKDVLRSAVAGPFGWVTVRALHHYAEHPGPARLQAGLQGDGRVGKWRCGPGVRGRSPQGTGVRP